MTRQIEFVEIILLCHGLMLNARILKGILRVSIYREGKTASGTGGRTDVTRVVHGPLDPHQRRTRKIK